MHQYALGRDSETEERSAVLGHAENRRLNAVVHTLNDLDERSAQVGIISAREAAKREQRDYENMP